MVQVAALTQLTRLSLSWTYDIYSQSCFDAGVLNAITGLRSLSLCWMHLEPQGLPLIAQGCGCLTELVLKDVQHPPPAPVFIPCVWPALLRLEMVRVDYELLAQSVLPDFKRSAPLLQSVTIALLLRHRTHTQSLIGIGLMAM
jgi:hypothetical protein